MSSDCERSEQSRGHGMVTCVSCDYTGFHVIFLWKKGALSDVLDGISGTANYSVLVR